MPQTTLPTNSLALTKGGAYVELHYNATCEAPAVGGGNKKIANIFVAGQPQCYSKTCDQQRFGQDWLLDLFRDFPSSNFVNLKRYIDEHQ